MDTPDSDAMIGRLLDGRYQVVAKLARGGMATVYRAQDTRLDRPVALKVMHPGLADDQAFVSRFIREGRSAAALTHPGVVGMYDQGEDGGTVYLVMEYVPGRTLRDLLRQRGRITPREAFDVLEPVLSALGAAHAAGLVHRDIKPENVLLADDGRIKVADFGLARSALAGDGSNATQGVFMGTVAYLAPELVAHGSGDARSDVYSAGIMLYEMLTGSPPYTGDTPIQVAYLHVNHDVPPPSAVLPGLADDLDVLVQTATDRNPDHRPADATALLRVVQGVRSRLSPEQLGFAPAAVDLTETLVVPTGLALAAYAGATAGPGVPASAYPTTNLPLGGAAYGAGPHPSGPMLLTPEQVPSAARKRQGGRRLFIGLTVLMLLAGAIGYGAWFVGARTVPTPSVLGQTQAAATAKLTAAGLKTAVGPAEHSETIKLGLVLRSDPSAGDGARKGSTVTLILSSGPERFAVPDLLGRTPDEATGLLSDQNLIVGSTTTAYSESVDKGLIISTDPAKDTPVKRGTAVRIVVSKGIPPSVVPKVIGLSFDDATKLLAAKHLGITKTGDAFSETVAKDAVISQSQAPGTSALRDTKIGVVVSKGPPLVQVPDVFKKDRAQAKKILEKAGFVVVFFEPFGASPFNQVLSEDPGAGSMQPKGSTIRVGIF